MLTASREARDAVSFKAISRLLILSSSLHFFSSLFHSFHISQPPLSLLLIDILLVTLSSASWNLPSVPNPRSMPFTLVFVTAAQVSSRHTLVRLSHRPFSM